MPIGKKRMSAVYKGRNVATRPIPRDVWTDDFREQERNAEQKRPRMIAPNVGKGPNVNAPQLSGKKARGSVGGAVYSPRSNAKQR